VTAGAVRARGYAAGGYMSASGGIIETLADVDRDADGIPDWWVQQYFGHPTGQSNDHSRADDDASGTGQNNRFKFIAGLEPTNSASVFQLRIESIPGQPGWKALIFRPRWTDRTYAPQFRHSLLGGPPWAALTNINLTDDGAERTVTDLDGGGDSRFYRIQIPRP